MANVVLLCLAKVTSPDVVQTREAGDLAQTLGYGKDGDAQRSLQLKISHLKGRMLRMQHMFGPTMHGDSQHQCDEVV